MAQAAVLDVPVTDDLRAQVMGRLISRSWDYGSCWGWEGATNGVGYGQIYFRSQRWYTHRLSYTVCRGPIPAGLVLDHLCGFTLCFRPDHLEPVTHRVNLQRALTDARTHCKNDHAFTEANTYTNPATGHRTCRACRAARQRVIRQRIHHIGRGL
jgi:hypothetical protein